LEYKTFGIKNCWLPEVEVKLVKEHPIRNNLTDLIVVLLLLLMMMIMMTTTTTRRRRMKMSQ